MKHHHLLNDLAAIEQQLIKLVRGPGGFSVEQPHGTWSPAVDIYETPTNFILTAEVPGVKNSEIDIKVIDGTLILRGERRWNGDVSGENFHQLESSSGKFERTFALSERIAADQIRAELDKGVLKVILPKRTERPGKQIEIKTE